MVAPPSRGTVCHTCSLYNAKMLVTAAKRVIPLHRWIRIPIRRVPSPGQVMSRELAEKLSAAEKIFEDPRCSLDSINKYVCVFFFFFFGGGLCCFVCRCCVFWMNNKQRRRVCLEPCCCFFLVDEELKTDKSPPQYLFLCP